MCALDVLGKCILTGGIITALLATPGPAHAGGYSVLHSFNDQNGDGTLPGASVIRDNAGNLYGTTEEGGGGHNRGIVYKLAPDGTETVLHSFGSGNDGADPYGGVIRDSIGNLYGTTDQGGTGCQICGGAGTVFKLAPDGTETVLYNFCSQAKCSDGVNPFASLIKDSAGNLYGTTYYGGIYDYGAVFKLASDGTEKVLYSFCSQGNCTDGAYPVSGLIKDKAGYLYGTTPVGGAHKGGVVYKLASDGTETVLYSFCSKSNCTDGFAPAAGVITDESGNLYGTTDFGGGGDCDGGASCGVVFKLAPNGTETVLHKFSKVDGGNSSASLIRDKAGNLYGTTFFGGKNDDGTVFKLAPDGTETLLHSFRGGSDGKWPKAGLIKDNVGYLYGSTFEGGANSGAGIVFKLRK